MKYLLIFVLAFFSLPCYSQETDGIAPSVADVEASSPSKANNEADEFMRHNPSLEQFLQHQEELWIKEKAESNTVEKTESVLPPPSILEEKATPLIEPAVVDVKKVDNKKAGPSKSKTIVKEESSNIKNNAETVSVTVQEETSDKSEPVNDENKDWPAFYKGLAFALVLGAIVWVLSKYQ